VPQLQKINEIGFYITVNGWIEEAAREISQLFTGK